MPEHRLLEAPPSGQREAARLARLAARSGVPLIVRGRPGAGVTTVLDAVAARAARSGRRVVQVEADPFAHHGVALSRVLRARAGGALLVHDDLDRAHPAVRRAVADLAGLAGVTVVVGAHDHLPELEDAALEPDQPGAPVVAELAGWDRRDHAAYLGARLGEPVDPHDPLVIALARACGCNPGQLVALCDDPYVSGRVEAARLTGAEVSSVVLSRALPVSVQSQLLGLSTAGLTIFQALAVAGSPVPVPVLARLMPAAVLHEVAEHPLVETAGGRLGVRHGAVARLVRASMTAASCRVLREQLRTAAGHAPAVRDRAAG